MFFKVSALLAALSIQAGPASTFNILANGNQSPKVLTKLKTQPSEAHLAWSSDLRSKQSDYSEHELEEMFGLKTGELRKIIDETKSQYDKGAKIPSLRPMEVERIEKLLTENTGLENQDVKNLAADLYGVSEDEFELISKGILKHNSTALEQAKKEALESQNLPMPDKVRSQKWVSFYLKNLPEGALDRFISLGLAVTLAIESQSNFQYLPAHILHLVLGLVIADFATAHFHWFEDTYDLVPDDSILCPNRAHHFDPHRIKEDHPLRVVSKSMQIALPLVIAEYFLNAPGYVMAATFLSACGNWFHQMAHHTPGEMKKISRILKFTQEKLGAMQPYKSHNIHHFGTKKNGFKRDSTYFAMTNWFNGIFDSCHYWRNLEALVKKIWGLEPREFSDEASYNRNCLYIDRWNPVYDSLWHMKQDKN